MGNNIYKIEQPSKMIGLSPSEIEKVLFASKEALENFRKSALAVLNTGSDIDDISELNNMFSSFDVVIKKHQSNIYMELHNPPENSFVDGEIIEGVKELLYSVLRDVLLLDDSELRSGLSSEEYVYNFLRRVGAIKESKKPNLAVCWGGHSINSEEYEYTKAVGYQLGLRGFDICTGCGPRCDERANERCLYSACQTKK